MALFDDSGSGLIDQLSQAATDAAQVYNAVTNPQPTPAAPPVTTTAAPGKTNWLLIGGIGAAVLLIVVFVFGGKR